MARQNSLIPLDQPAEQDTIRIRAPTKPLALQPLK